jgi:peptide/nickel transport system permease protein
MQFGYLLGGTAIVEQVFALPGMGRMAIQAVFDREYTILQGMVLVVAIGFVLINLAVDILYSILDPRIRFGGE